MPIHDLSQKAATVLVNVVTLCGVIEPPNRKPRIQRLLPRRALLLTPLAAQPKPFHWANNYRPSS